MTDESEDLVRAAHLLNGVRVAISKDGKHAMLVFEIAAGEGIAEHFAITCAVGGLGMLGSMVQEAKRLAIRRDLNPGDVALTKPESYAVGHADHIRGHTLLTLDANSDKEMIFVFADRDAANVANAILDDIRQRNDPNGPKLLTPTAPRLILPALGRKQ